MRWRHIKWSPKGLKECRGLSYKVKNLKKGDRFIILIPEVPYCLTPWIGLMSGWETGQKNSKTSEILLISYHILNSEILSIYSLTFHFYRDLKSTYWQNVYNISTMLTLISECSSINCPKQNKTKAKSQPKSLGIKSII